jgi:CheY-like chemotaxis protein
VLGIVLVVDDEAPFREYVRQMLQGSVGRVVEAEGGTAALEIMRRLRPDLVLLDWRMPDGGGERVVAEALDDETLRDVPITIITSVRAADPALLRLHPGLPVLDKSELTKESLLALLNAVRAAASTDRGA